MNENQRLKHLYQLGIAVGTTLDLAHETAAFMDWLDKTVKPSLAALFITDKAKRELRLVGARGFETPLDLHLPMGLDLWRWLAEQGASVPDEGDPRRYAVPILTEMQILGTLCVVSGCPPEQIGEEQRLVNIASSYLAPVLRNIWRYQMLEQQVAERTVALAESEVRYRQMAKRLQILREIDQAILKARSSQEISRTALGHLRRLVPYQQASIAVFDFKVGDATVLAVDADDEMGEGPDEHVPLGDSDLARTLRRGEIYVVEDAARTSLELPPAIQIMVPQGMRSYIMAPLVAGEELIGLLNLGADEPGAFTGEHVETAREVADLLAIAIQQARLHREIQGYAKELERRVAERTAELQERVKETERLNRILAGLLGDLQVTNRRLETATRSLQRANEELEAFAYSVSHDLRAPLRAMQGFASALLEDYGDRLDAVGRDYANRIVAAAQHMDTLIEDLLSYSRLSRIEVKLRPVSLEQVVGEVLAQLEGEIRRRKARIRVEKPLPEVMGHQPILVQVLSNLLSNALKFVAPDRSPRVRVWAEESGERVRLWVEDNGIGIASGDQERIFRIFERLHGIEKYPGTGIGLAIVKKGVEHMGGRAGVESEPGRGSRFWVELEGAGVMSKA